MGWWPVAGGKSTGWPVTGGGGADSGQAANPPGFFDSITGAIAGGITGAAQDANQAASEWAGAAKAKVVDRMAGGLPGYGDLWSIGADGVQITQAGKLVAAAVVVGLGLLMFGGKRGRRW